MKKNILRFSFLNKTHTIFGYFLLFTISGFEAEAQNAKSTQGQKSSKIDPSKNIAGVKAEPKSDFISGSSEFIEQGEVGRINWSRFYVEGDGYAVVDTIKHPSKLEAMLFAQIEAEVDAQNNLTEVLKGTFVEGISNVGVMSSGSEENNKLITSLVKSALNVGAPFYANGKCKISKRVPLYQNGLAKIMVDDALANNPSEFKNPFIYLNTETNVGLKNVYMNEISQVILLVEGPYQPSIFPSIANEEQIVFIDFANGFMNKLKQPPIVKLNAKAIKNLSFLKNTAILKVQQDKNGNLVLTDSSKEKLVGYKGSEMSLLSMVKTIAVQD